MKAILFALFVGLLMVGCEEDIEVPKMIACDGCGEEVSSAGESCPHCSHPIADSIAAIIAKKREAAIETNVKQREVANKIREAKELDGKVKGGGGETSIDLSHSQITDVTPLTELTSLKVLSLTGNQIADVTPLAELTELESLWLSENKITDISPLAGLKNLKILALDDNPIPEDQKAMIKKALPNCEISF